MCSGGIIVYFNCEMKPFAKILFASLFTTATFYSLSLSAQFIMHGHTVSEGGSCYELTSDSLTEGGSVWYSKLFNLNQPLDVQFSLFLGCKAYSVGADGMAFVLQPLSTNQGFTGGGLGYGGITPSLDVEFDTYQNLPWDPAYAHIAIEQNGDYNHNVVADLLAGPVQMSPLLPNLPDCKVHQARIIWNPKTQTINVYFDCSLRCSYTGDIVNNIFGGNPNVYWGFTASTGGASNIQGLCIEHTFLQNLRDTTICNGTALPLQASGGVTYSWTPATGLSSTVISNPVATPSVSTKYYVTATDSCGISALDSISITVDAIALTPMSNNVNCFGGNTGSASVAVSGGMGTLNYNWLPSGGTAQTASSLIASDYSVTVSDSNNCKTTNVITITQPAYPLHMTVAGLSTACSGSCDGQAVVIPAGGTLPYTAIWSNSVTGLSINGLCSGTYSLSISDASGCTRDSSIFVPEPTTILLTPSSTNAICNQGQGSVSVTVTGGSPGPGYAYFWSNGSTSLTGTVSGATLQISNAAAGTYTITITDQNSCSTTTEAIITQPPALSIAAIPSLHACIGQNSTLTVDPSGGTPPYTFNWNPGVIGGTSITVNPSVTSTYTVTASDANGCESPGQTVRINVNPPLLAEIAPLNSVCPGTTVTLQGQAAGGDSLYTYTWLTTPAQNNPSLTLVVDSQMTCKLVVSDGCGTPADTALLTLNVNTVPVVKFTGNLLAGCPDLCVDFTDKSTIASGSIAQWNWNFGDSSSTVQNPHSCFKTPGHYSVTLTVKSDKGCSTSDSISQMITVYPKPVAAFSYAPQTPTVIDPVQLTNQSTGAVSWMWNLGDPGNLADTVTTAVENPVHNYSQTGNYCVLLTVANTQGCVDTVQHCITVIPEFTFYIPNTFTPNGDGHNDIFNGSGIGINTYKMMIFDRWGSVLFSSQDPNSGWNGTTIGGSDVAKQDIYVYQFEITDAFNKYHTYSGQVLLMK